MKKKIVLLGLMLQASSSMFAQTANSRSDINSMLSSWLIPAIGLLMLGGFIGLVIYNQEALRGKNGLSKQDGWISVGEGMIFIVVGIAAIGFIASKLASMNCKVYRGLDSPCKIKGLLSHYFYIVFCAYLVSFVFVLFSFSSILQKGTVLSFLMEAVIELGIPTALYVYFYRKSDKVKIRKDNRVITISNRGLYRALNQRRYGQ